MTERIALAVFESVWALLLLAAVVAQVLSADTIPKRRAGVAINTLVIAPFVLVLGLFYLGRYSGTFEANPAVRSCGAVAAIGGMAAYMVSHLYLRRNWSLTASVREGHQLVTGGAYRFVRHPMYSSMTLTVLGSGLLMDNYLILASTVVVGLVYYVRAKKEEELLWQEFPEFSGYASRVKMFIPFVF